MENNITIDDRYSIALFNEAVACHMFEGLEEADFNSILNESENLTNAILDIYNESILSENIGYTNKGNVITKTKEARLNWLKSRSSIAIAAKTNDPLYIKLKKFSKLRKQMIEAINKKFASYGTKHAKELLKQYKANSSSPFEKKKDLNTNKIKPTPVGITSGGKKLFKETTVKKI